MFSRSPATTDPGVFSISSPSLVSAGVSIADVTIADVTTPDFTTADVTMAADGADTRATAGSSSIARTGGSAGAQAVTSAIAPMASGPMRATRPLVRKLQDGNKIASPDRAIRNDWGCRCQVTVVRLGGSIFLPSYGNPNGPSTVISTVGHSPSVGLKSLSLEVRMYNLDEQKASLGRFRKAALLAVVIPAACSPRDALRTRPRRRRNRWPLRPPPPPPPPMPPVRG